MDMDYVFKPLEDWVARDERRSSTGASRSRRGVNVPLDFSIKIAEAKHSLAILVLTSAPETTKNIVQFHQESIVHFARGLLSVKSATTSNRLMVVKSILKLLQDQYPEYFDFEASIPDALRISMLSNVSVCMQKQEQKTDVLDLIENSLATVCRQTFTQIRSSSVTFARANGIAALCESLYRRSLTQTSDELEDHIRALFIQFNIDSVQVFNYFVGMFRLTLTKCDSDRERLSALALQFKKISQVPLGLEKQFSSPHLKTRLLEWLVDENSYLERRNSMQSLTAGAGGELSDSSFKILVDMSVAQLAFLTRAFVESGVIQNKNTTEMMAFLSKFINTKRSGSVSPESLRIKYYDVESATKDSVRNVLHNAIGYINRS